MRRKLHIGDEMDIKKEREAFEAEFSKIKSDIAFWLHTWDEEMQGYNHPVMCWFWYMWQAKKQATPEGFVLVPKDQITCFWQDNDEPENFCNSPSDFDILGDCIDLGDIMQINKHTQANIGTEKLYGTWVADAGNPLERSRSKFFVGTESECKEIVLENERVFEKAQEQSHD